MKIVDFKQISSLGISGAQCVNWVEEAFLKKDEAVLPAKISIKLPENVFFNTMPSYLPWINKFGVKVVSRYPTRYPAISSNIQLFDSETGEALALLDGDWITAMRTGAVAALAIKYFARSGASTYSFLGLGNTARATVKCLLEANPGKHFRMRLLAYKDQAELFKERFKGYANVDFDTFQDVHSLIAGADVVVSCITAANELIAPSESYKEGVLIVPVHTRGFQNCDLFFDRVFADDVDHVKDFKNFNQFKQFAEFKEVISGRTVPREGEHERILSYNIGIALHDVYFAAKIYEMVTAKGGDIDLISPKSKFWV